MSIRNSIPLASPTVRPHKSYLAFIALAAISLVVGVTAGIYRTGRSRPTWSQIQDRHPV